MTSWIFSSNRNKQESLSFIRKKWLHFLVKSQETNKHSISSKVSSQKKWPDFLVKSQETKEHYNVPQKWPNFSCQTTKIKHLSISRIFEHKFNSWNCWNKCLVWRCFISYKNVTHWEEFKKRYFEHKRPAASEATKLFQHTWTFPKNKNKHAFSSYLWNITELPNFS